MKLASFEAILRAFAQAQVRYLVGRMSPNSRAPSRGRVSGVSGACIDTKSDSASGCTNG